MDARRLRWVGVALIALPACAIDQREFESLREQVQLQQRILNDQKARQEELVLRVDTINNGFRILGDKADENSQRIDDLGELLAEQGVPVAPAPMRLGAPPATTAPSPAGASVMTPPPAAAPAPAAPPPAAAKPILLTNRPVEPPAPDDEIISAETRPDKLYVRALQAFNQRDYDGAAGQFRDFLVAFPDHILAGNAQYWIGECLYTQKRFAAAAAEFAKVERGYPKHRKVPDALLKEGLALRELRRTEEAREALERILADYPKTEAAAKAREFLARWK